MGTAQNSVIQLLNEYEVAEALGISVATCSALAIVATGASLFEAIFIGSLQARRHLKVA